MPKRKEQSRTARAKEPETLKGWQQIAKFLGQPVATTQRWAKSGMPVARQGRYVTAVPEELNRWLSRESGSQPVHIATDTRDLSADLKRGLSYLRQQRRLKKRSECRKTKCTNSVNDRKHRLLRVRRCRQRLARRLLRYCR